VHWPLAARLYLPAEWIEDPARLARAGVPQDRQLFREMWRIALDLLDEIKPQLPLIRRSCSMQVAARYCRCSPSWKNEANRM
jgi:hypothetical protein